MKRRAESLRKCGPDSRSPRPLSAPDNTTALNPQLSPHAGQKDQVDLDNIDLYDARVGGGWLRDTSTRPCVRATPARNEHTRLSKPVRRQARSEHRRRTVARRPCASVAIAKPSASTLATAARTGVLTISARVVGAGTLTATARVTIARSTQIAKTTKAVKESGTVKLALQLSAAARQKLRRRGASLCR